MTRLLYWTEGYWPYIGGPEIFGPKILAQLKARGYDILVVAARGSLNLPDEETFEGIPIHRFPFYTAFTDRDILELVRMRRRIAALKAAFKPDLIHLGFVGPGAVMHLETARAHPAPMVATLRGMLPDHLMRADGGFSPLFLAADWITANARAPLDQMCSFLPQLAARTSVIIDGIDPLAGDVRPFSADPLRLLYLGRLSPEKGIDLALRAFATLLPRFPDARLNVAGDGPERAPLEHLAADLGITHAVEFLGWVAPEQVRPVMSAATFLVMPSWTESLPMVVAEAAQVERAVIGTRVGGVPEVIQDGENGLMVDAGDLPALTAAMASLMERPERARHLGLAARRTIADRFSLRRSCDDYDALFQRLIREHRGAPHI